MQYLSIKLLWFSVLCLLARAWVWTPPCSFKPCGSSLSERVSMSIASANMVVAIVNIKASSDKYGDLRKALFSLSGPTEAEAGCKGCRLYQDVSDACALRMETRWTTHADLLRHIRSDRYKRLLLLMELGSEQPTIEFYTVSELRGLDFIRKAREGSD
jgi:quinol monooxygenase YgiN